MCGRFFVDTEETAIGELIGAAKDISRAGKLPKTGEVFPTNTVAALAMEGKPMLMEWGFPRNNAFGVIINARSETASERPMFRRYVEHSRCLVPSCGYYEWARNGQQGTKGKPKFLLKDIDSGDGITWLAGIYALSDDGECTFVILTRPAASCISHIHDRMPVILPKRSHDRWLCGGGDAEDIMQACCTNILAERIVNQTGQLQLSL